MPRLLPYKLTFEARDGYLYARIDAAEINQTTSAAYLKEVGDEFKRTGSSRLMIDRRIPHVTATIAKYALATASADILPRIKTAWVNPYPEHQIGRASCRER